MVSTIIVFAAIIGSILMIMNRYKKQNVVCRDCGNIQCSSKISKANGVIIVLLLLLFIIPGLIYEAWGQMNKAYKCIKCNGWNVIPVDTLMGQELINKNNLAVTRVYENDEEKNCPQCAEKVKKAALICRHCRFEFKNLLENKV